MRKPLSTSSSSSARRVKYATWPVNTLSLLKARYIVETEDWKVLPVTDDSPANELLATALSAARLGDQATLRQAEAALGRAGGGRTEIMQKMAGGLLHAGMGHASVATTQVYADVLDEDATRAVSKPLYEGVR